MDRISNARNFRYFKASLEVIRLAVMPCIRFLLSLRNAEAPLCERRIDIAHETVRFWWKRFKTIFAASALTPQQSFRDDKRHEALSLARL